MRYYDAIASGYDELYGKEQAEKYRSLLRLVKIPADWLVLDAGCGTGLLAEFLPNEIIGVDISDGMLKIAAKRMHVRKAPLWRLPFADKQFDATFCITVMQDIPSERWEACVKEMLRVTKKLLVISILKAEREIEKFEALMRKFKAKKYDIRKDWLYVIRCHNLE